MELKELMLDDLVMVDGKIGKIKFLTDSNALVQIGEYDAVDTDSVEPIPLTPEILEKNGWEERPTGYVFYTDGKRYDNSLWYIFGSNTFVVNTAEFQIKYVHEFQHILKLCGIDREIVL